MNPHDLLIIERKELLQGNDISISVCNMYQLKHGDTKLMFQFVILLFESLGDLSNSIENS